MQTLHHFLLNKCATTSCMTWTGAVWTQHGCMWAGSLTQFKKKKKNPQISSWQRERTTARRLDSQWVKTEDLTETMAERRNQNALVRSLLWRVKAEEPSVEFTAETNGAEQQQARPPGRKNVNIYCCFWILHWKQESIQRIHRNYTIIYGFTEAVNTYRITIYKKIYFTEI